MCEQEGHWVPFFALIPRTLIDGTIGWGHLERRMDLNPYDVYIVYDYRRPIPKKPAVNDVEAVKARLLDEAVRDLKAINLEYKPRALFLPNSGWRVQNKFCIGYGNTLEEAWYDYKYTNSILFSMAFPEYEPPPELPIHHSTLKDFHACHQQCVSCGAGCVRG
jgi:hypothetical protein